MGRHLGRPIRQFFVYFVVPFSTHPLSFADFAVVACVISPLPEKNLVQICNFSAEKLDTKMTFCLS